MKRFRDGYWNSIENVVQHIGEVMKETEGCLPTKDLLIRRGYGGMVDAINRLKMWPGIIKHFGFDLKKKCYLCGKIKPLAEFRKHKQTLHNNRYFVCGPCEKTYQIGYKYRNEEKFLRSLMHTAKGRCRKRGIRYQIDFDFIYDMYKKQQGKCALTGISLEVRRPERPNGARSPYSISIDRINPAKGYAKNNVRIVCWMINNSLNVYGEKIYAKVAVEFLKKKGYLIKLKGSRE
jgi:hypothetical protein